MTITINGTTGITNDGGYTGDGVVFADTTPANTLVTTTGGNVGFGTSLPNEKITIASSTAASYLQICDSATGTTSGDGLFLGSFNGNAELKTKENLALALGTNNTERARIDSSGNLLVGKTSAGLATGVQLEPSGGSSFIRSSSSNSDLNLYVYSTGAGAARFYVGMGGTVFATSTSISAISDATLKENVRDLETGLPEVMALKPRRFDWKNGDAQDVAGFVAQEVEQVLPELVTDYVYNKDEDGNDIIKKSLKMGDILPTLVKAIQEQQAIILAQESALTALTARVAALDARLTSLEGTQP